MDQMRDFQHPIIWSLENGFQSLAYTKPPKGSPYVEQWNARVKALVKMDGEKAMGELDFLIWFSPWHRFQWNKRNRLDVDPVKRCVEKWMAPYNWNADDERALLLWRMNKFAKKQGPIGGYGRYSEAEMLKRGHDWPSYGYP